MSDVGTAERDAVGDDIGTHDATAGGEEPLRALKNAEGSSPPGDAALHTVSAYRALGNTQYGRSDFTAPSVPYDRRCSATGANPAADGATSLRPAYEVADADGPAAVLEAALDERSSTR